MSDDSEDQGCPECPSVAGWVTTFADLMSLLMCFFVLLLSFSEMDATKFKRLAGSMAQAFGVQNVLNVTDIPKGTSVIAQEFSPGRPEPTPINQIYQFTRDLTENSLDVQCTDEYDIEQGDIDQSSGVKVRILDKINEEKKQTESNAIEVAQALHQQIVAGQLEVETEGRKILIRIKEQGSFASGTGELDAAFLPIMQEIREVLAAQEGTISVEGHTDNIPITSGRYRSNWDLSAARAVSVAHELFIDNVLQPRRFMTVGFADTRPLVSNDTPENRAKNRRVEIVVRQGMDQDLQQEIRALEGTDAELFQSLILENDFVLNPNEVF